MFELFIKHLDFIGVPVKSIGIEIEIFVVERIREVVSKFLLRLQIGIS